MFPLLEEVNPEFRVKPYDKPYFWTTPQVSYILFMKNISHVLWFTWNMSTTNMFISVPTGSLLDFLKSDEGNRVQLPKLIDFSAQVRFIYAEPQSSIINTQI